MFDPKIKSCGGLCTYIRPHTLFGAPKLAISFDKKAKKAFNPDPFYGNGGHPISEIDI